jgi:hypothetical protein
LTQETENPLDRRNAGKPWTDNEVARLRNLSVGATPLRLIVRELGRPEDELRVKAGELGFTLGSSTDMSRFKFYDA